METPLPAAVRTLNGRQQTFLDCFRLCAALCVLCCHVCFCSGVPAGIDGQFFIVLGDLGVVMFFLLSGFLAAYALERKCADPAYCYRDFFLHKLRRILREYVPALLFIAALDALSIRLNPEGYRYYDTYNIKTFCANLLFLQWTVLNRLPGVSLLAFGSARPLWTLAPEWYFYQIHALLMLALRGRGRLNLRACLALGLALLLPIEFLIGGRGGGLGFVFALGALGYSLFDKIEQNAARLLFPLCLLLVPAYCALKLNAYSIYVFLFLWMALCAGLRLLAGQTAARRNPVAAWLSGACFMLYMLHFSILDFALFSGVFRTTGAQLAAGILLSLSISCGMYALFGRQRKKRAYTIH